MELYIPPPSAYLPRLPPPRPILPTVPVVPAPDLPDVLNAPEGPYTLAKGTFPEVELPGPLPNDLPRPGAPGGATLYGAGGFGMAGPSFVPMPQLSSPNIFAVSSGSTLVNGQWQPGHPCRLVFADVWYPGRVAGKESSFGALVRLGLGKKAAPDANAAQQTGQAPPLYDEEFSDTESEEDSDYRPPTTPAAREGPELHAQAPRKFGKDRKIRKEGKTLSASRGGIITRVSPNMNLGSIMDDKGKNGGERVRWAFWNMGRLFAWAEEGGATENLATVVFQQPPTAHAISQLTIGPDRQDIVVGLETGDLIYLDFINDRTERFNAAGKVIKSPVASVHFDPRGGDRFTVLFADNTIAQYHLFAEDPSEAALGVITLSPRPWTTMWETAEAEEDVNAVQDREREAREARERETNGISTMMERRASGIERRGSVGLEKPLVDRRAYLDRLVEWKNDEWNAPPEVERRLEPPRQPWAGRNPISVGRIGASSPITAMAYSPDGRWLAITTKDGLLRLLETEEGRVTDVFESYFAALTCVAWSSDSRFVAVGGQDDLVTIYSARESRLVARCQGHTGYVTCIAFDPTMRSSGRGYRFGSVGEDGKLLLWDFSAAALRKPRHHHSISGRYGAGPGSSASLTLFNFAGAHYHAAPPKTEVALLQPVLARIVEGNLMTSLHMGPKSIATVSRAGSIKFWTRPPRVPRKRSDKKRDH
ncbi:uncharacterized protein CcaverHIS019_0501600 [Cutaneotrichosporon cavernicola]|uniref:Anaphase-promoting complex subunit 4-like WD40 domain-containing protein n=1 Tax=Cutaneotrichosporon cavernicola TaxID=279322 RepID=A0AA48L5V7_9TREE|nr:uncharacterized protein CcaverHIS019_0501600 [Cutaneotrichosporon cavernicola]BEI92532.1 hypothetical protein CcaverHIS019_0501600 [Cutaneotrichosporon cavernicola]BEJ00305.1 hypothetical protein CcaverHIS631_0501620 [Cutaneotrichosporon cavernicola]